MHTDSYGVHDIRTLRDGYPSYETVVAGSPHIEESAINVFVHHRGLHRIRAQVKHASGQIVLMLSRRQKKCVDAIIAVQAKSDDCLEVQPPESFEWGRVRVVKNPHPGFCVCHSRTASQ